MAIRKATECKDKKGRPLKVGDEILVRGKIIDLPMDLEEKGKAIAKVKWHGAIPLSDLVESTELEKVVVRGLVSGVGSQKKKTVKRKRNSTPLSRTGEPEWR